MVSAFHPTSDRCLDTTDLTLGADAACYHHVFPQHATETDRCSICSDRLVSRVPCVVFAVSYTTHLLDARAAGSWIDSLPERHQLVAVFLIYASFLIPSRLYWFDLLCGPNALVAVPCLVCCLNQN